MTRPTAGMRAAMASAEVGDDVMGDDPTVSRLESLAAEMLGKEAAAFTPSATQANLIAQLTHCARGDEVIVGQEGHTYLYEGGGAAVLGGIQPQPLNQEPDGTLDLGKVEALIKPDDFHFARTRVLALENTTWGKVLPQSYLIDARKLADEKGLILHLDGARIFNAAIASKTAASEIAAPFDSVSVCLSKGLGAPVGAVLVGSADFIKEAKRWRKVLGGGMRQSGIIAAAGIYALENNIDRLAEDHQNAKLLAKGLAEIEGFTVDPVQTNMVFAAVSSDFAEGLGARMEAQGVKIYGYLHGKLRLVTHLDVTEEDIERAVATFRQAAK